MLNMKNKELRLMSPVTEPIHVYFFTGSSKTYDNNITRILRNQKGLGFQIFVSTLTSYGVYDVLNEFLIQYKRECNQVRNGLDFLLNLN